MKLRFAGTCRGCGQAISGGEWAVYHPLTKAVECLACAQDNAGVGIDVRGDLSENLSPAVATPVPVVTGTAGASARREYDRRAANREARIRHAHPHIGGLILALSDEPQHTQAWAQGARGETLLGRGLDRLSDRGALLLHDRRIPPTRANIDHIAISSVGVFVIDAKRYRGRPQLRIKGGLLRPRTETLLVGGRDCTKLVVGIRNQVELVHSAISTREFADVPVHGMLCFVEADWPMIGGSFTTAGIDVLWPRKAADKITASGLLGTDRVIALHRHLANAFPPA